MKKKIWIIIAVIALIAACAGGYWFYKTHTPEYMLAKTILDVKESGIDGLKPHLTDNALKLVESAEDKLEEAGEGSGLITGLIKKKAVKTIKSKASEIEWSVDELLKGKDRTEVVIRFNYKDKVAGTINLILLKVDGEWKIDGVSSPRFDTLDLL